MRTTSIPSFVGLDYHQDSVQVCILDSSGKVLVNRSVANDARGIASPVRTMVLLSGWLWRRAVVRPTWPMN